MPNVNDFLRKVAATDDKAPMPPKTGNDQASMKHFYGILAFTLATIVFGIVVAFVGLF